jgi:hypothetical protein
LDARLGVGGELDIDLSPPAESRLARLQRVFTIIKSEDRHLLVLGAADGVGRGRGAR